MMTWLPIADALEVGQSLDPGADVVRGAG